MELGIPRGSLGSQPVQGRDGPSPHGSVKQGHDDGVRISRQLAREDVGRMGRWEAELEVPDRGGGDPSDGVFKAVAERELVDSASALLRFLQESKIPKSSLGVCHGAFG